MTPAELNILVDPVIRKSANYDFALCMLNENQDPVVSVTNLPYSEYASIEAPKNFPPKLGALFEILDALSEGFSPANPKTAVCSFTWCTREDYTRKGLFQKILEESIKKAKEEGYKEIMADCMNQASQGVARKLGFYPVSKVYYKTFMTQDGKYPFAGLPENECTARMYR